MFGAVKAVENARLVEEFRFGRVNVLRRFKTVFALFRRCAGCGEYPAGKSDYAAGAIGYGEHYSVAEFIIYALPLIALREPCVYDFFFRITFPAQIFKELVPRLARKPEAERTHGLFVYPALL